MNPDWFFDAPRVLLDITGLDPVDVFLALYRGARVLVDDGVVSREDAYRDIISDEEHRLFARVFFPDSWRGRSLKIMFVHPGMYTTLAGEYRSGYPEQYLFRTDLYDRENGEGKCKEIIEELYKEKELIERMAEEVLGDWHGRLSKTIRNSPVEEQIAISKAMLKEALEIAKKCLDKE